MERIGGGIVLGLFALPLAWLAGQVFSSPLDPESGSHANGAGFALGVVVLGVALVCGLGCLTLLDVRSRVAVTVVSAVVLAVVGAVTLDNWLLNPAVSATRRDAAVLDTLPVFPGAVLADKNSTPADPGDLVDEPSAPVTSWTWNAPRGVQIGTVARWYASRLRAAGWSVSSSDWKDGQRGEVDASRDADNAQISVVIDQRRAWGVPGWPPGSTLVEVVATAGF